jgi:hypothetical protein
MAIAPSKLGSFIREASSDDELMRKMRYSDLVRPDASDEEVLAAIRKAWEEHSSLGEDDRSYNSPEERARVFLEPYLSAKGRKWAVPLKSLDLPDD